MVTVTAALGDAVVVRVSLRQRFVRYGISGLRDATDTWLFVPLDVTV